MKVAVKRRIPVTAIGTDEAVKLLHKLNLHEDVLNGKAVCHICGEKVTLNNIGGVLMVNGQPVLVCDKPSCIAKAAFLSKEKQQTIVVNR